MGFVKGFEVRFEWEFQRLNFNKKYINLSQIIQKLFKKNFFQLILKNVIRNVQKID